jgi:serine/threonine protein kinase
LDRVDETLTHQLHKLRLAITCDDESPRSSSNNSTTKQPQLPINIDRMEEKLDLAMQVASALQYMHAHNIIYRDIKPSNVGLVKKRRNTTNKQQFSVSTEAVLLDFGLCRELPFNGTTEQTKKDEFFLMSMVGTRRFMAPEVALGEGYNLQADVYSFTLMVYELMTLVTPYAMYSREMHECLVLHDNVRPQLSPSWPGKVRSFFEHGWARNPIDRPTISEVIAQLDTLVREEKCSRSRLRSKIVEATGLRVEKNDNIVVAIEPPQTKKDDKLNIKRITSASNKRVWFPQSLFSNINDLPSLLRKASSSFYESGGSCCTTTSTASLSRGTSDVSIADTNVEAE